MPNRATTVETSPVSHTVTNPSFLPPPPPLHAAATAAVKRPGQCPLGQTGVGSSIRPTPATRPQPPPRSQHRRHDMPHPHRHRRRHDTPHPHRHCCRHDMPHPHRHRCRHDMPRHHCHRCQNGCHITVVNVDATRYRQRGGYWGEGQMCREEGRKGVGRETKMQDQGDDDDLVVVPANSQRRRGGGGSNGASSFCPSSCLYSQCQKWGGMKPTAAPF